MYGLLWVLRQLPPTRLLAPGPSPGMSGMSLFPGLMSTASSVGRLPPCRKQHTKLTGRGEGQECETGCQAYSGEKLLPVSNNIQLVESLPIIFNT